MSRPLRIRYPGAVYHVACRGNDRQDIFRDSTDRTEFLEILAGSQIIYNVKMYAAVLIGNHFHLLLETPLGKLNEFIWNCCIGVGGLTGDEIGSLFGIGASAVSQERKRLVSRMAEDASMKKLFDELFLKCST